MLPNTITNQYCIPLTTCRTLHEHHQHLEQLIYNLQNRLELLVEQYWMTLKHSPQKEKLFAESYYLNELIGYVKQQCSLVQHYEAYLRDFPPDRQFTSKAFFDYLQDQGLKARCEQKLKNQFYRNVWLKNLQYLKKQYLKNKNLHAEMNVFQGDKEEQKNPQESPQYELKKDDDNLMEEIVGGMR